jgi:hypothetical protein
MKISRRDWAQLSAYLDGELSQRDIKKLEKRIDENPDFQAALEGLRSVKAVLAHTPALAAPRNFILKPSLVESSPRRQPTQRYRLATAVMTFLFIGVVVVDVGSNLLAAGFGPMAPMAEEVMLESAAKEMEDSAWAVEAEAVEEPASTAEMEMAPVAPEQLEAVGEGDPEGMEDPHTKSGSEEADRTADSSDEADLEEPQELPNALSEGETILSEEDQILPSQESERSIDRLQIPWLLILEITLGLGAVGFAVAAWINRRKNRSA